ncbi:hypothetical protein GCM10023083_35860 [Streptomyces phyllanthi]
MARNPGRVLRCGRARRRPRLLRRRPGDRCGSGCCVDLGFDFMRGSICEGGGGGAVVLVAVLCVAVLCVVVLCVVVLAGGQPSGLMALDQMPYGTSAGGVPATPLSGSGSMLLVRSIR